MTEHGCLTAASYGLISMQPGAAGGQENQPPGRSAGGFSAEIHAPAGAPGYPVNICLTAGQVHDGVPAEYLPENQPAEYVTADKSYDSGGPASFIISQGSIPVIPSRSNMTGIFSENGIRLRYFSIR